MDRPADGNRLLLAAALAASLLCAFAGQHDRQLRGPDEAREAGITAEMARTGDWVVPRLNGRPFLEKPPLFHAAGAGILRATGSQSPLAFRASAALFALATLAATFLLGRRIGGTRLGAVAVLLLATTSGFHAAAHRAVTDNAIPPFVTLAFIGLASLLGGEAPGPALLLAGAASGTAFLAKGAVGPALIAVGWGGALLAARRFRILLDPWSLPALLLAVLPPTAWLLALHAVEGPEAVRTVLVHNNWERAAGGSPDHAAGPLYYLAAAPVFLLPWIPLAALGARRCWREGGLLRIPPAWFGAGLLLLTAAAAKRPVYLLPLAPAAALMAAVEIEAVYFRTASTGYARAVRTAVGCLGAAGLAGGAVLAAVARPEDLLPAVAGVLLAGAGAVLLRGPPARTLALSLAMAAGGLALGFRALGPAGDAGRGMDAVAEQVALRAEGREPVLFRPTEEIEGILSLRMGGPIPVARTLAALEEERRLAHRDLLVVVPSSDPRLREFLASASASWRVEAGPEHLVLVVLHGAPVR